MSHNFGQERSMRVPVLVLALLAMPIAAGVAQGRGKQQRARNASASLESDCKEQHADALSRAVEDGHAPYGLDKKCSDPVPPPPPPPPAPVPPPLPPPPPPPPPPVPPPPPPPAPDTPPTGPHQVRGIVFEDLDGNGLQDPFAGELGLAGWTVSLSWNGQLVATTTSDADGNFIFEGLGNTGTGAFEVFVQLQSGYNQTSPVGGAGCGGAGFLAAFNNSFMTWFRADFAEMLQ